MFDLYHIERRYSGRLTGFWTIGVSFDAAVRGERLAVMDAAFMACVKKSKKSGGTLSFLVYRNGEPIKGACVNKLTDAEYNANWDRLDPIVKSWRDASVK